MAEVIRTKQELRQRLGEARRAGKRIGLVPTMGALHAGHRQLIEACVADSDLTVVSIFVNPTQFGADEDFDRYPRQLEADEGLIDEAGGDIIFVPAAEEMYAEGQTAWVEEERLAEGLCGARRPGHFRGVLTVCAKLFNIVEPAVAYFGKKDYQQFRVIERMVRDLDFPLEIRGVETVRESDGLALSSRNEYLTPEQRQHALGISRALKQGRMLIQDGERSTRVVVDVVRSELLREGGLRIDYIELVDAETLEPAFPLSGRVLIAVAAFADKTRLIDNVEVECPPESDADASAG